MIDSEGKNKEIDMQTAIQAKRQCSSPQVSAKKLLESNGAQRDGSQGVWSA